MKIEIGKTYRCRNGRVGVLGWNDCKEDRDNNRAELHGAWFSATYSFLYEVGGDGRVWSDFEDEFDIVACVDDELPEECAVISGMTEA